MDAIYIVGLIVLVLLVYQLYSKKKEQENFANYIAKLDGETYKVRRLPDAQDAAEQLAFIRQNLIKLNDHFRKNRADDERCARFVKNFRADPEVFSENDKDSEFTSFTQNKGEQIRFCLRQRGDDESLVDNNTMMFVALHECGHVMSIGVGHNKEFWTNFRYILEEAIQIGIYKYQDFKRNPVDYCGTRITDTPLQYSELE